MLQYFIQFSANASTVLDKNVSTCSLRAWAIALVAWISAVFSSCKLPKEILLPSRTLLPLSSVKAPAGYSYKNSNNRNEKKRESARGKMEWMRALFSFLTNLSTTQRGFYGGERLSAEGDVRKRVKFMQALTPVVQKLTNPTLRIILYPKNSVTGWVIDYIVTDFTRNMMIRIYEKDVSFIRNQVGSKEKKSEYSKMQ